MQLLGDVKPLCLSVGLVSLSFLPLRPMFSCWFLNYPMCSSSDRGEFKSPSAIMLLLIIFLQVSPSCLNFLVFFCFGCSGLTPGSALLDHFWGDLDWLSVRQVFLPTVLSLWLQLFGIY